MNSVPILQNLSVNEKIRLVDAFDQKSFEPKTLVIKEVCVVCGCLCMGCFANTVANVG